MLDILRPIQIDEAQAKKLKAEPKDEVDVAMENALEGTIKTQTKQLFKVRDKVKELCNKGQLQNILFTNKSGMVVGLEGLLDRCADFLTFGALAKCQKCKNGDMIFAKHGYSCNGQIDEWTQCLNFETKPLRMKCKIPAELKKDEGGFFSKYKSKVEDRAVRPSIPNIVKIMGGSVEEGEAKVTRQREPLYNMHVIAVGLSTPKDELKRLITKLGGKLVMKFQKSIAFVISTKEEVEKMNSRMQEAKSFDIHVVGEDFLAAVEKCTPAETVEKIKSMSICSWGSDPLTRIPQEESKVGKVNFMISKFRFNNSCFYGISGIDLHAKSWKTTSTS